MKLAYQAYDRAGNAVTDTIEAADGEEAKDELRRRGFFVTQINAAGRGPSGRTDPSTTWLGPRFGRSRQLKQVAMFTRQLYVLLTTGTPMVEALSAVERQTRDQSWRAVIGDLRLRVEEGCLLSDALASHPECFDQIYRCLVAAGESGGKFEPMLDRLSQLTRKQLQTRTAVVGALIYPALLLGVASVVLVLMLTFVLPRFADLFMTLDLALPLTTKAMMFLSIMIRSYWWLMVLGSVALAAGWWSWSRTAQGRYFLDTLTVRLPVIGPITRSFITARIARLLGVLSDSFVPLLDALALTKDVAGNAHYHQLINNAEEAVTRGDPVSSAFRDERLISPSVYEAFRSGEATGRVSSMLLNLSDFMDEENEAVLKALTVILEPIILIGLGVFVGLVALSMFMPLFDLAAQAGG